MTPKKDDPRTAMEALDEGLTAHENIEEVETDETASPDEIAAREAAEDAMPAGHDQIDSDMTPAQILRVRANMYFFHGLVGIVLLPFALLLRTGRWSMRTLIAHHNGWEFGSW